MQARRSELRRVYDNCIPVYNILGKFPIIKATNMTRLQFPLFIALLSGLPLAAYAAGDDYCATAQQRMVNTDLEVINEIHDNFDTFVQAKPVADPLTTQQYVTRFRFPDKQVELAGAVSCKFKSAAQLGDVHGADKVGEQLNCRTLMQDRIDALLSELGEAAQLSSGDITVRKDKMAKMGPGWLKPWPYPFASEKAAGKLEIRAKGIHAPYKTILPIPKEFRGTYSCHLPHDEYLRALLTGQLSGSDQPELAD